jgi:hypothetical protein
MSRVGVVMDAGSWHVLVYSRDLSNSPLRFFPTICPIQSILSILRRADVNAAKKYTNYLLLPWTLRG